MISCNTLLAVFAAILSIQQAAGIFGGQDAKPGQFPSAVGLRRFSQGTIDLVENGRCMGVLITNQWVLATARCVKPYVKFEVLLGGNLWSAPLLTIPATEFYVIETFNEIFAWDDVALIKLSTPVTIIPGLIEPAKFPKFALNDSYIVGKPFLTCGYGFNGDDPTYSNILRSVPGSGIANTTCQYYWERIREFKMCTFDMDKNICFGDPGAPLYALDFEKNSTTFLVGFGSFHNPLSCETIDSPAAFNRVDYYIPWIKSKIGDVLTYWQ